MIWARFTMAGILLVAGCGKLLDLDGFVQAVINYQVLPRRTARKFARIVPWLELVSAVLLLSEPGKTMGALMSGGLVLSFSIAIVYNLLRGRNVPCGCMGRLFRDHTSWPLLLRNVLLIGLSAVIALGPGTRVEVPHSEWFPTAMLIVAGVIILTLFNVTIDFIRQAFFETSV
jgi:peptidoglycan/LPS O-acetylase OafA/YrhL